MSYTLAPWSMGYTYYDLEATNASATVVFVSQDDWFLSHRGNLNFRYFRTSTTDTSPNTSMKVQFADANSTPIGSPMVFTAPSEWDDYNVVLPFPTIAHSITQIICTMTTVGHNKFTISIWDQSELYCGAGGCTGYVIPSVYSDYASGLDLSPGGDNNDIRVLVYSIDDWIHDYHGALKIVIAWVYGGPVVDVTVQLKDVYANDVGDPLVISDFVYGENKTVELMLPEAIHDVDYIEFSASASALAQFSIREISDPDFVPTLCEQLNDWGECSSQEIPTGWVADGDEDAIQVYTPGSKVNLLLTSEDDWFADYHGKVYFEYYIVSGDTSSINVILKDIDGNTIFINGSDRQSFNVNLKGELGYAEIEFPTEDHTVAFMQLFVFTGATVDYRIVSILSDIPTYGGAISPFWTALEGLTEASSGGSLLTGYTGDPIRPADYYNPEGEGEGLLIL